MSKDCSVAFLPEELLLSIFREVCDLETQGYCVSHKEDETYLNHYRRSAKVLRRVSRFWRHLVDLPSSYYLRITTAYLSLFLTRFGKHSKYREHVEISKSMLSVRFDFLLPGALLQREDRYSDGGHEPLVRFLDEVRYIMTLQDRLIGIHGLILDPEILEIFLGILQGLDGSAIVRHINFFESSPNSSISTVRVRIDPEDRLKLSGSEGLAERFSFDQLNSVRGFRIHEPWCTKRLKPPCALSTLEVGIGLPYVRSLLSSCGDQLEFLGIHVAVAYSRAQKEEFRSCDPISLPSLKSLSVRTDSIIMGILLKKLICLNVQVASLSTENDQRMELPDGFRTSWNTDFHGGVEMPNLKQLHLMDMSELPFCVLGTIQVPPLEHFTISDSSLGREDWRQMPAHVLERLRKLRFKFLELDKAKTEWFSLLARIFDLSNVEGLRITLPDYSILNPLERIDPFLAQFPSLRQLAIAAKNLPLISRLLSSFSTGQGLESLEVILQDDPYYPKPDHLRRFPEVYHSLHSKPSELDRFAEANAGAFGKVKTLITAHAEIHTSQVPRFLQSLCTLCGNMETLVIKDLTVPAMQELRSLKEVQSSNVMTDPRASEMFPLRIEHVVLETTPSYAPTFDHLLDLKPKLHQVAAEFAAFRATIPGTADMKSFTVRLIDALELPERVDFNLECGAVLRLEVAKENTCAGRQSLMGTNALGELEL